MELINTIGTRVRVRDEHADRLIAAGYTRPASEDAPAKAPRRTTTRAATTRTEATADTGP